MPPELLGSTGLLVAALLTVGVLWRDHMRSTADDRKQRDDWKAAALAAQATVARLTELLEHAVGRDRAG